MLDRIRIWRQPATNGHHKEFSAVDDAAPIPVPSWFTWKRCCVMAWASLFILFGLAVWLMYDTRRDTMSRFDSIEAHFKLHPKGE